MQQNAEFKQANKEFAEFLRKYRAGEYTNNNNNGFTNTTQEFYRTRQRYRWPFNSPEIQKVQSLNWKIINKFLSLYFFIIILSAIFGALK